MKKQIVLTLTLLVIVTLAACGGQTPPAAIEPAAPTQTVTQPTQPPAATETDAPTAEAISVTEAPAAVSFANDIMPILNNTCVKCHGVEDIKEGLDMRTYETLIAGSFNGAVFTPGNAADSLLVQQLIKGEMPKRAPKLSPEQIQIISDWVDQGALNN